MFRNTVHTVQSQWASLVRAGGGDGGGVGMGACTMVYTMSYDLIVFTPWKPHGVCVFPARVYDHILSSSRWHTPTPHTDPPPLPLSPSPPRTKTHPLCPCPSLTLPRPSSPPTLCPLGPSLSAYLPGCARRPRFIEHGCVRAGRGLGLDVLR